MFFHCNFFCVEGENMKKKIVLTVAMVVVCFVVILAMVFMIRAQRNKNALSDIKADAEEVNSDAKLNQFDFITDKNYRIWKMGWV